MATTSASVTDNPMFSSLKSFFSRPNTANTGEKGKTRASLIQCEGDCVGESALAFKPAT
ncbi:hypothetical protein KIN20_006136 [Parelaphostrongylus tenuis]|uniref:Uncharacterized protein n=1 Tax=Parelaphostrongylus tenuis TaxID=148309 RepID=A0AAD5M4A3_PARTN|nr:hypothetical protein KIN20_006136 [Parelaphostrongylus tenuis]